MIITAIQAHLERLYLDAARANPEEIVLSQHHCDALLAEMHVPVTDAKISLLLNQTTGRLMTVVIDDQRNPCAIDFTSDHRRHAGWRLRLPPQEEEPHT